MGAYAYCPKCEGPLTAPWDLPTENLLKVLFLGDSEYSIKCHHCRADVDYLYKEDVVEEVARRIG